MTRTLGFVGGLMLLCSLAWSAPAISSSFVDVVVLDVPLGTPHAIQDAQGRGLVINNLSDEALVVHVDVMRPENDQLRGNAEPIPDTGWITVEPSDLFLPARGTASFSIRVRLPRGEPLENRFFQAMIWSRARPITRSGVTVSLGLKSRLRLKTAGKDDKTAQK